VYAYETKYNPNSNPTTKQHAVVSLPLTVGWLCVTYSYDAMLLNRLYWFPLSGRCCSSCYNWCLTVTLFWRHRFQPPPPEKCKFWSTAFRPASAMPLIIAQRHPPCRLNGCDIDWKVLASISGSLAPEGCLQRRPVRKLISFQRSGRWARRLGGAYCRASMATVHSICAAISDARWNTTTSLLLLTFYRSWMAFPYCCF